MEKLLLMQESFIHELWRRTVFQSAQSLSQLHLAHFLIHN
jgi:hypothetical protein